MTFSQECSCAAVRSAIRRESQPHIKYWKNHIVPLKDRVPLRDHGATDWEEFDPREHEECSQFCETPA